MRFARYLLAVVGGFGLIQLIPYGRDHSNPPKLAEPEWDSPDTRSVFFGACRDCHSNQTEWPWYSSVAPASWLMQYHVDEGRSHLNVSEWGRGVQHGDDAAEMIRDDEMPPSSYLLLHSEARLSPAQREQFIEGLERTFGTPAEEGHSDDHDHAGHEH